MTRHGSGPHRPHGAHEAREETQREAAHDFSDPVAMSARLDGPARDAKEFPEEILAALELHPSLTVADVGAGTGYFTVRLARAVPEGVVIATDVEPALVRALTERVRAEGLHNVRVVQGGASDPGLAPASVDRILLLGVWHHLQDRATYARALGEALAPGGRILIVEGAQHAHGSHQPHGSHPPHGSHHGSHAALGTAHPHGPHQASALTVEHICADLDAAGMEARASPSTIPGRILVEAHRP